MRIYIEVKGGNLQCVYCDNPNAEIYLVDWDNLEAGADAGEMLLPSNPDGTEVDDMLEVARAKMEHCGYTRWRENTGWRWKPRA